MLMFAPVGLVGLGQTAPTTGPAVMVPYEAVGRHFRLQYPQSWLRQPHTGIVALTLRAEKQLEPGDFAHTLAIAEEEPHGPPQSLDGLAADRLKELTQELPGASITAAADARLGQLAGKKFIASYSQSGLDVQVLEVVAFEGTHVYTVTYTAEKSSYDNCLPAVQTILESFETTP